MFIGYFTERPYQDPSSGFFGATGRAINDLGLSNVEYDPRLGADLYHRYLDEKIYIEEVGFDGFMLNEHHSTPFCMGSVINVEAAILARITRRAKIVLLGNVLPIWEDPLWLAEELAEIDMISRGRLVTGWVRGTGRESIAHNSQSPYNWERFKEAHEFVVKAWTTPGPYRWEGEHYHFRYVNPWCRPYQDPHPPIWVPGGISKTTVEWAAGKHYPYIMLATALPLTQQSLAYYDESAREAGYEAGPQHKGYLFKVHVEETEELAAEAGKKFIQGPSNPFLEGNAGQVRPFMQSLPGMTSRTNLLASAANPTTAGARGFKARTGGEGRAELALGGRSAPPPPPSGSRADETDSIYERQIEQYTIISGTPKTVLPKIRHVLETLRTGNIFFWDGDGAMTHEDAMRSLRLFGEEVLPAVREMGREFDLPGAFDIDPITNEPVAQPTA